MSDAPNRIRELRREAGLSQEALGERIGVTKVTVSDLERGNIRLDVGYMRRIAVELGVAPADLLAASDNPGALSIEERHLIGRLRQASADRRSELLQIAAILLG